jgi:hypothetical protein
MNSMKRCLLLQICILACGCSKSTAPSGPVVSLDLAVTASVVDGERIVALSATVTNTGTADALWRSCSQGPHVRVCDAELNTVYLSHPCMPGVTCQEWDWELAPGEKATTERVVHGQIWEVRPELTDEFSCDDFALVPMPPGTYTVIASFGWHSASGESHTVQERVPFEWTSN